MQSCVLFKITNRLMASDKSFPLEFLSDLAGAFKTRGFSCGKVGKGKGCPAGLICYTENEDITVIMTEIRTSTSEEDLCSSIASWSDPVPVWQKWFSSRNRTRKGTFVDVCDVVRQVLTSDERISDLKWMTMAEWSKSMMPQSPPSTKTNEQTGV